jgi:uncharacterized Zn finger protein
VSNANNPGDDPGIQMDDSNEMTCPWCDQQQTDTWEWIGSATSDYTHDCDSCGRPIQILSVDVTANVRYRRSAR